MSRIMSAAALALLVSACVAAPRPASTSAPVPTGQRPAPPPQVSRPAAPAGGFRAPKVMSIPGLEDVIGKNATALANMFGPPRLTVNESDAQKLQFSSEACVLDVYLYPLTPRAQPTATYVNARRPSDGQDVDRAACARALRR